MKHSKSIWKGPFFLFLNFLCDPGHLVKLPGSACDILPFSFATYERKSESHGIHFSILGLSFLLWTKLSTYYLGWYKHYIHQKY